MQNREIVIGNPRGLHMRVAAEIVKLTRKHGAAVRLARGGHSASGDSILDLLLLDAGQGTTLNLQVEGHDERAVAGQISELFSDGAGI